MEEAEESLHVTQSDILLILLLHSYLSQFNLYVESKKRIGQEAESIAMITRPLGGKEEFSTATFLSFFLTIHRSSHPSLLLHDIFCTCK